MNAGGFYLRALRVDERIDDTAAVGSILELSPERALARIDEFTRGWAEEQTDVTCLAIITYDVGRDDLALAASPGHAEPDEEFAGPFAAIERFVVATYRQDE